MLDNTHLPKELSSINSMFILTSRVHQEGEARLTFAPSPPSTVDVILEAIRRGLNWTRERGARIKHKAKKV